MDAGHNRSKWRTKCVPYILLLLTFLSQTEGTGNETACAENEYPSENGVCCDKCPPGFRLTGKCPGHGLRSTCEKCNDETYQDQINSYRHCFRCTQCKKYEVEKTKCMSNKDRVCECIAGYYRKKIDSVTSTCQLCKKCGDGERESRACSENSNIECQCKDSHYRVNQNTCAPCKTCNVNCSDLCTTPMTPKTQRTVHPSADPAWTIFLVPLLAAIIVLLLVCFVFYVVIKKWRKKKRNLHRQSESPDSEKDSPEQTQVLIKIKEEESTPLSNHKLEPEQEQALPDCVPREIRTHEFIYFVLEVVPVKRFKELVRRLDVSEQDIDRAERDNRAFIDAQYQMLKIWSDNAVGGGRTILPRPLLQELADRLKDMNLNGCAESIENKYCTEC